jgi:hypothetical protein
MILYRLFLIIKNFVEKRGKKKAVLNKLTEEKVITILFSNETGGATD